MADTPDIESNNGKDNEIVEREFEMLAFWKARDIFKQSVEKKAPQGDFVFYEGPPTANGHPGIHHLEARAFKDAIPRYKTMRGYRVRRRAGWDTHGLPVELQVEKALGFSGKKDIETYGVAAFNAKCKESVHEYIGEWQEFTDRMGYWVDQENAYFTFKPSYIESLWHVVKKVNERSLLYKDYKVVPWCARCGTALSSHELAQGYADAKDLSVTAKFKVKDPEKHGLPLNTYLLAWTTTPWTLPGNVALAVGEGVVYVAREKDGEFLIFARDLAGLVFKQEGRVVDLSDSRVFTGKDLVGIEYEPLFPFAQELAEGEEKKKFDKAFTVYPADFVTTEDGTGIVHTAVMYGQDDFELGTKVGLPKVHTVGADGKFVSGVGFLSGRFVRDEDVAVDIIKDLAARGLLFAKSKYEHTYPFCWRCKTPLIYYARDSWYIRMSELRDTLIAENKKVHWEPEHIQEGRFGEWLSGVKDWAISRERYWGTPLPIWENVSGTERVIVGSLQELRERMVKSGNHYFILRHGESEHNRQAIISSSPDDPYTLTEKGREEIIEAARTLKEKGITKIIASPMKRTVDSAELLRKELNLSEAQVVIDDRLTEVNLSTLSGMSVGAYYVQAPTYEERFQWKPEGGETLKEVKRRAGDILYDLESTHKNERFVLVTHEYVAWMLQAVAKGLTDAETITLRGDYPDFPETGVVIELPFVALPHDEEYVLDLHRPYIDHIELAGKNGEKLMRVKEVMDVWFDSGAMPFAQDHYPFENSSWIEGAGYPADFISEAIDQTRGWFYTLLAVGVLMNRGAPYKNVICLGHLLDDQGQKMSKSKGNIVDPWAMMKKYGADILRLWMYTVNAPGDSKNFDEKTVDELQKKVLGRLHNTLVFYETYGSPKEWAESAPEHVLDRWILARLEETRSHMTTALDAFALDRGTRPLIGFIEDLSTWYIRRSRDRFRGDDELERDSATRTTRHVLRELSKLLAPFMPFYAEFLWQRLRAGHDPESVHLAAWPLPAEGDAVLLETMAFARACATEGLMQRSAANIKVRQPLQKLEIRHEGATPSYWNEILPILKDELNIRDIVLVRGDGGATLDTHITPELREEGEFRELVRAVQEQRKADGLKQGELAHIEVRTDQAGKACIKKYQESLQRQTSLASIAIDSGASQDEVEKSKFTFTLKR